MKILIGLGGGNDSDVKVIRGYNDFFLLMKTVNSSKGFLGFAWVGITVLLLLREKMQNYKRFCWYV